MASTSPNTLLFYVPPSMLLPEDGTLVTLTASPTGVVNLPSPFTVNTGYTEFEVTVAGLQPSPILVTITTSDFDNFPAFYLTVGD